MKENSKKRAAHKPANKGQTDDTASQDLDMQRSGLIGSPCQSCFLVPLLATQPRVHVTFNVLLFLLHFKPIDIDMLSFCSHSPNTGFHRIQYDSATSLSLVWFLHTPSVQLARLRMTRRLSVRAIAQLGPRVLQAPRGSGRSRVGIRTPTSSPSLLGGRPSLVGGRPSLLHRQKEKDERCKALGMVAGPRLREIAKSTAVHISQSYLRSYFTRGGIYDGMLFDLANSDFQIDFVQVSSEGLQANKLGKLESHSLRDPEGPRRVRPFMDPTGGARSSARTEMDSGAPVRCSDVFGPWGASQCTAQSKTPAASHAAAEKHTINMDPLPKVCRFLVAILEEIHV